MIVVIEGCDNSGKTTLALELAKRLKGIFIKTERVPPEREDLFAYQRILYYAEKYGNGVVISDRHAGVSDPIYGKIIRSGTKLDPVEIRTCLDRINAFVYCRPSNAHIIGRMPEREQMHGVIQNIEAIINAYDEFFFCPELDSGFRVWTYDYSKDSVVQLAEEIKRYA